MKKKYLLVLISVLAVVMITYFPIKKTIGKIDFMSGWGKILSDDSKDKTEVAQKQSDTAYKLSVKGAGSEDIISSEDIFEAGNDVLITNQEIEIAKAFYVLQGQSEKDAAKTAVKYVEEYNAMYIEAVNNGYDVNEKEVDEYISDLKTMTEQAENSDDVKKVIAQFDTEEEYWHYQRIVCQKQLPIQKYVQSLEHEYSKKIGEKIDSAENTAIWNDELNKIKEEAAKKQQYKKLDSINEIDKKFEVQN